MDRIDAIRKMEKDYHDQCYENHKLFEPGSWLQKPVKTIMDLLDFFNPSQEVNVLDLGSGVGRNSIPIAQRFQDKEGKVVSVDLLESAVSKLEEYSSDFGVNNKMEFVLSDIADYPISKNHFDLIFSVSSLEHLDSEKTFDLVLKRMISGTKDHGLNAIIMSTGIKETLKETGKVLEPMYELLFETYALINKLETYYQDWAVLKQTIQPYQIEITREGRKVCLTSDVVTWIVQKRRGEGL